MAETKTKDKGNGNGKGKGKGKGKETKVDKLDELLNTKIGDLADIDDV